MGAGMKRYRTREAITFAPGARLELAPEQSAPRAAIGALKPVSDKKGETVFTVERPVEFKAGEVIGTDDDMPRAMTDRLLEETRAKPQAVLDVGGE